MFTQSVPTRLGKAAVRTSFTCPIPRGLLAALTAPEAPFEDASEPMTTRPVTPVVRSGGGPQARVVGEFPGGSEAA